MRRSGPPERRTPLARGSGFPSSSEGTKPKARRSPTTIDVARARALYADGMTMRQVAGVLGCNHSALSRRLARDGFRAREKDGYAAPIDVDEVIRLYQDGHGYKTVARLVGIETPDRIRRIIAARGLSRLAHRPKGRRSTPADQYEAEFRRMRVVVRRRSGGRCEAPCSPGCVGRAAHVHHRKLRSQGGSNDESNLVDLCHACHSYAHDHPEEAYRSGLLVRSWADPALVPLAP